MIISLFVVFPLMFWFLFSCLCWIEYFTFPSILSLSLFSRSLPLSLFLCWLLNGPFAASFFFISLFSTQFLAQLIVNKIADDWIRTADLWCRKRSRYQLNHNQCPPSLFIFCSFIILKPTTVEQSSHFVNCTLWVQRCHLQCKIKSLRKYIFAGAHKNV